MILWLVWLLIIAACIGFLYNEGLWSNVIRLINVVTAALLAMNFFEPLARWLAGAAQSFTYFWDFIAIWSIFGLAILVMNEITNRVSQVQVKFLKIVDQIGGGVVALLIGWIMICFTATTLHMAPLVREPFGGAFAPEKRAADSLSPEMLWLGFTQKVSMGAFVPLTAGDSYEKGAFDPKGEFLPRYASRRARLQSHANETGTVRIRPDQWTKHY